MKSHLEVLEVRAPTYELGASEAPRELASPLPRNAKRLGA